ncbi:MAG: ComEA family DNA-binding protein [Oscillospiraceae bacterium]|nr:ComEA family DNA-binding protein [Oscillospiraceae bacterium]MDD4367440.1 ComEA family DNA-binding protein [Oscillospiraceae bacterium]
MAATIQPFSRQAIKAAAVVLLFSLAALAFSGYDKYMADAQPAFVYDKTVAGEPTATGGPAASTAHDDETDTSSGQPELTGSAAGLPEGRPTPATAPAGQESAAQASLITVHISGAVQFPGVYSIASDSVLNDLVTAAGGLCENAAADYVNLAMLLQDHSLVRIPFMDEVTAAKPPGDLLAQSSATALASAEPSQAGTAGSESQLIDINSAGWEELTALPGIGESYARAIVKNREAYGPFASPEDIMRVTGIKEKKYEQIKDLICAR